MRNSFATKILSIALMILTPSAMVMAETSNTMLYAKGTVLLNGADVARSAAVTAGDKIDTAGATATTIDQNGSKVSVNPYSSLRYEANGLNVYRGGASVQTSSGMSAKVSQITVAPADKNATYEIARLDNKVTITSRSGALMITDAGATTTLEAGASSTLNADPTPTPAPAPQAAPTMVGSDVSHGKLIAIGAVVAGVAVACGLWCGTAASSVPPNGFTTTNAQQAHLARHMGLQRVIQVAASHPTVARAVVGSVRASAAPKAKSNRILVTH
jgi:hypothetical protein